MIFLWEKKKRFSFSIEISMVIFQRLVDVLRGLLMLSIHTRVVVVARHTSHSHTYLSGCAWVHICPLKI